MFRGNPMWIIINDNNNFLGGRTTEGKQAAMIFRAEDLAEKFIVEKGLVNHHPLAIPQSEFADWLRKAVKQGFSELYVDPNPHDDTHRTVPAFILLTELESLEGLSHGIRVPADVPAALHCSGRP